MFQLVQIVFAPTNHYFLITRCDRHLCMLYAKPIFQTTVGGEKIELVL